MNRFGGKKPIHDEFSGVVHDMACGEVLCLSRNALFLITLSNKG